MVFALSVLYSAANLLGWTRPVLLRMGTHPGPRRTMAVVLGSLTFKAVILAIGMVLAYWPERSRPSA